MVQEDDEEDEKYPDSDIPEHWKNVKRNCKYDGSLEPECIEAFYFALDLSNNVEWIISMRMWFKNQPWLAFFGWPISFYAGMCAWYFLFFPN